MTRDVRAARQLSSRTRPRRADTMVIAMNLALVVLVLLPGYVVIAALLEVVFGSTAPGGTGALGYIDSVRHHAKDRWWVPLLYLFVAPFVSALLVWHSRRRTTLPLRLVALISAPAGFLALFLFLFGQSAAPGAVVRAALPGVLATLAYAAVMRLPRSGMPPTGTGAPDATARERSSG